jgi:LuxR family maltose regulon positive regulatory protein
LLADECFSLVLDGLGPTVDTLLAAFPKQALGDPELLALLAYRELSERSLVAAADYLALAERRATASPPDSRYRFDLQLALTRLALARRRGDLDTALREVGPFLEPVEAYTPHELALGGDARAVALMNLAIVELWSSRLEDAERHLEQALALAREIHRPFVEIACLSHLGLLTSTRSFAQARTRCEEAIRLAEVHGWEADPVAGTPIVAMASMDTAQGRFEEAHSRLDRAAPLLRDDIDPASAMLLHFVRGDLLAGEGRLREAIESFEAAGRLQSVLATRHVLTGPVRESIALALLRAGDPASARKTLAELPEDARSGAEAHVTIAALHMADDMPAAAIASLVDVLEGTAPVLRVGTMVQALVLAAAAQDQLDGAAKAEDLIERALDLAEADGLVLPFLLTPAPQLLMLLERHPHHRTAHAALLADLVGVLSGSAPALRASRPQALVEELSSSELRVLRYLPSNLTASEIAAELYLSTSTIKTHMRHVYEKLDAHRRTEAVERARALGLLGPSAPRRS